MLSAVQKRLLMSLVAQGCGQIITIVIQIVSIPLFLSFWGTHLYGEWILLTTIPAYLSLSNLGFGDAAATEMTLNVAQKNIKRAIEVYQSTWILMTFISLFVTLAVITLVFLFPIHNWFRLTLISESQAKMLVILLALQVIFMQQRTLLNALYRSNGFYAKGVNVGNVLRLFEFAVSAVVIWRGGNPVQVIASILIIQVIGNGYIRFDVRRLSSWMEWGWSHANTTTLKRIAGPALGFMGFPLGHALSLQGMVMVIGLVLGPVAVVLFSTTRTLTRFIWQALNTISNSTWVEYSVALGKEDFDLARNIHRRACQLSLWLAIIFSFLLFIGGKSIYTHWTKGKIIYDPKLFGILLLVAISDSLWSTSYVVPMAINKHQKMAVVYVAATSSCLILAWGLTQTIGLYGAAAALLAIAAAMNVYVLKLSLQLLHDNIFDFARCVLRPPSKELQRLAQKVTQPLRPAP